MDYERKARADKQRRAEPIKQTVGFQNVSSVWNLDLQSFLRRKRVS